jgi:hypothetical protein
VQLVEVALYAGIISFAAVLGYESDKLKKVFGEMQVKLKKRLKDWET